MPFQTFFRIFTFILALALMIVACEPVTVAPATVTPTPTATLTRTPPAPTPTAIPAVVSFPTVGATPIVTATLNITPTPRPAPGIAIVQLVSPVSNTQISVNQTYNVVVYAAAESGIARIELTDDGVTVPFDNSFAPAPVISALIPWTPTLIGVHNLRAVAYDTSNHVSAPDEATIPVTLDTRKPTSIIVYPIGIPQIEFGSVLPIYGVATDEVGVTQVDLWVDGQIFTYFTSQNPNGQAAFPFVFSWLAMTPGNHTFFVRSHDNQEQTNDSAALKILVVDTQIPSVSVLFDRTNAPINEPITITVAALDASGIQRIDVLNGKEVIGSITSPNPARQTSLTAQIVWQNPNPGDYPIIARAYNAIGNPKDTPIQIVSVLRPGQNTPTTVPTVTPTRTRVRATATPRPQPPAAPQASITTPQDRFNQSAPLRVNFTGQASGELDHIELWGLIPGQTQPQIICSIDARTSNQKTAQCDWNPPTAGIVALYAQAIDIYHQVGRSAQITGFVGVPAPPTPTTPPTPTPTPPTASSRWIAITSQGTMTTTLRQSGATLRGDFKMSGVDPTARIVTGTVKLDRVIFTVDYAPATTPTPAATITATETPSSPLTIDFDCAADNAAGTLSCTYRDSRGRTGAAFFRRDTTYP